MKIYHYNSETLIFEIASEADICPVTGEHLIPAFSTTIKPPTTRTTHVPKFDGKKWIKIKIGNDKNK